ncbi:unnamed protein product [Eruca vesicaria subsp. sativa]|uniref:KIB1-4 beta-propeller domain-containing protein n=1 Tax=Eruca vesicaria subsp. sativa TaxID=29727 RepID=A0ABC8M028_ERUVS|nr:unnamed protein product [Eruca vesicaria subsp. sativa]
MSRQLKLWKLSLISHLASRSFSNCIFRVTPCGTTRRDGDVGNLAIYSYVDKLIDFTPKKVPMELVKGMGTIGASHGWVATLKNGVVCLQDDLDPNASYTDPKRIPLPPLVTLPHCQTQIVTNIAMSSSSPEDQDCIVAVKFLGPQLSLCRPAQRDCKWRNMSISDPSFFSSHVMYSMRDGMFSMPASGGNYTASCDLVMEEPKIRMLSYPKQRVFEDLYIKSTGTVVDKEFLRKVLWMYSDWSCRMEHYLVESGSETFLVKWSKDTNPLDGTSELDLFVVLRIDEEGNAVYTKDFAGLCFFISKAESFCLPASCLHDKRPNCIYHLSNTSFGIICMDDDENKRGGDWTFPTPFWFPPNLDSNGKRILSSGIQYPVNNNTSRYTE